MEKEAERRLSKKNSDRPSDETSLVYMSENIDESPFKDKKINEGVSSQPFIQVPSFMTKNNTFFLKRHPGQSASQGEPGA